MQVRQKQRGRQYNESGSTMIEFAVLAPVLALLAFAGLEFGLLYAQVDSVGNAARAGARMGSATGASATDDFDILRSVKARSRSAGEGDIQRVVIFKATGNSGSLPAECLTGSVPGLCNAYTYDALSRSSSEIAALETAWTPSTRVPGVDYLGVSITSNHKWITGIFGSTRPVNDTVVMQLEPSTTSRDIDPGIIDDGSVSFSPDPNTATGDPDARDQFDIPGFTPGVIPGFIPGVVPGFTPGVIPGFTPGIPAGETGGSSPGLPSGETGDDDSGDDGGDYADDPADDEDTGDDDSGDDDSGDYDTGDPSDDTGDDGGAGNDNGGDTGGDDDGSNDDDSGSGGGEESPGNSNPAPEPPAAPPYQGGF